MSGEGPGPREKLQRYVQRLAGRGRDEFLGEVKVPLLVQQTEPQPTTQESVPRFGTMSMNKENLVFTEAGLYVFPLRKSATNAFAMMVTIGRANNNDIVLPYDGISKFHAYFSNTGGPWVLVDAKSTNGTFLDGKRLAPDAKEKVPERPVVDISFSNSIHCKLYSPVAFFDLAQSLLDVVNRKKL